MSSSSGVKRVKTGCITCRIRRIKCDEGKPDCQKCLSTGRKCDGYSSLPFSRRELHAASSSAGRHSPPGISPPRDVGPLNTLVVDPAFSDVLEKRYFQFFRQRTVSSTNSLMDSRFWDRVVLQHCHTEPTVKHAILALSSLHQRADTRNDEELALRHQAYAEKQYQKALAEAQTLISSATPRDIDRILVACVVFVSYSNVRGDYAGAHIHTHSGRSIMAQHKERLRASSRRNDLKEIEELFARLDLSAITFSDTSSPYQYTLEDFLASTPKLVPDDFDDVHGARASLVDYMRWMLLLASRIYDAAVEGPQAELMWLRAEKEKCRAALYQWHRRFEEVVASFEVSSPLLTTVLRLWYETAIVNTEADFFGPETRYDAFMPQFERMVLLGEQIVAALTVENSSSLFGFDLGYTIPIFMAAQRCRDPNLRRRAVKVLRTHSKQEGSWESTGAATAVERWIEREEEGLVVTKAADIPEHRRIQYMDVAIDTENAVASLRFNVTPAADDSSMQDVRPSIETLEQTAQEPCKPPSGQPSPRLKPFSMSSDLNMVDELASGSSFGKAAIVGRSPRESLQPEIAQWW